MAAKGEKHISRAGATDKRAITVTLCESLDGVMPPFQLLKLLPEANKNNIELNPFA